MRKKKSKRNNGQVDKNEKSPFQLSLRHYFLDFFILKKKKFSTKIKSIGDGQKESVGRGGGLRTELMATADGNDDRQSGAVAPSGPPGRPVGCQTLRRFPCVKRFDLFFVSDLASASCFLLNIFASPF